MYRIPGIVARLCKPLFILALPKQRSKAVYLTFDDGPDPEVTPAILSLLDRYDAKATFFPIGQKAVSYPELIASIISSGHSVHLHSWSHNRKCLKSLACLKNEIHQCRIFSVSRYYRPPYGRFSFRQGLWLLKNGYSIILWNVSTRDYSTTPVSEKELERLILKIRPGDIILLHNELIFKDKTLTLAESLLSGLTQRGLTFEKIF